MKVSKTISVEKLILAYSWYRPKDVDSTQGVRPSHPRGTETFRDCNTAFRGQNDNGSAIPKEQRQILGPFQNVSNTKWIDKVKFSLTQLNFYWKCN